MRLYGDYLQHLLDEGVDGLSSVAEKTVVEVGSSLVDLAASGRVELERPEEVSSLLEVRSAGGDLVDKVFNANDVFLSEVLLNNEVRVQRNSLSVDLAESSLVDKLGNGGSGWVATINTNLPERNPWLNSSKKALSSFVSSDDHGVVDLSKSEKLQDLSFLRRNSVDTLGSDDKDDLGFGRDKDLAVGSGSSALLDDLLFSLSSGFVVSLSSLEPFSLLASDGLSSFFSFLLKLFSPLGGSLLLLLKAFWNWSPDCKAAFTRSSFPLF